MHVDSKGKLKAMRRSKPKNVTDNPKPSRTTVTIRVNEDLWQRTKHRAVDERRALGYIVEDALRDYLGKGQGEP